MDQTQVLLLFVVLPAMLVLIYFGVRFCPSPIEWFNTYQRERDEVEFHIIAGVVYNDYSEDERDELIEKYVGWSDRRWNGFKDRFGDQMILRDFVPDIDMLRALK